MNYGRKDKAFMNILEHYNHDEIISIVRNLILVRVVEDEIVRNYGKPGDEQHMVQYTCQLDRKLLLLAPAII